jgi:branched-chain amino acid transport system permease protein
MEALGYNTNLYRFFAIVISSIFAGIGGILALYQTGTVSPTTGDLFSVVMVLMASLIGGVYRIEGGIIGSIVTVFLINFTRQYTTRYWIFVGIIFILVMIFFPGGLLGINFRGIFSNISTRIKKGKPFYK